MIIYPLPPEELVLNVNSFRECLACDEEIRAIFGCCVCLSTGYLEVKYDSTITA